MADNLNNDRPISAVNEDRFNRAGFAAKIAQLCTGKTSESRVIGIFGKWGDGKSSLLNMVSAYLPEENIQISFNPWLFRDEQELLLSFFRLFAEKLGGSITTKGERVKKAIAVYGESIGLLDLIPGASPFIAACKNLFKVFAKPKTVNADEAKERVKNLLIKADLNVTVLIDDIDRLDNKEVKAVFKLVKLLADFPRTTYILAFDPEIVARMLAPDYGGYEIEYGYKYLEKVIQLPLIIPMVHDETASRFLNNALLEISTAEQLNLENEREKLAAYYADGLLTLLDNPRKIIRVCNSLKFSLPILKEETDFFDLLLIETLKVTAPELFHFIRNNRDLMTDYYLKDSPEAEADRTYARTKITEVVKQHPERNISSFSALTCLLFPNFAWQDPAEASGINPETAEISRRICSPNYFDRYFTFTLLETELPDGRFRKFYIEQDNLTAEEIAHELDADIKRYDFEKIAYKLASHRHLIKGPAAEKLILVLSRNSNQFESPAYQLADGFRMLVITMETLIKNLPTRQQFSQTLQVIQESVNLNFAADVAARFIMPESKEKSGIYFSQQDARNLKVAYLKKLKKRIEEVGFFEAVPESRLARQLVWWHETDEHDLSRNIDIVLFTNHEAPIKLLRIFTPTLNAYNQGQSKEIKANFDEEQFALLDRIVGAQKILTHLNYLHFKAIEKYDWSGRPGLNEELSDEEILNIFSYLAYLKSGHQGNGSGRLRDDD